MGKTFLTIGALLITIGAGLLLWQRGPFNLISPRVPKPTPLAKYSIENLRQRSYQGSRILLEKIIKEEPQFTSYLFSFITDGKKVTGQANMPRGKGKFPVVVMLRGYADREIYFTGLGTRKAAAEFAKAGFIALAPDFLGFGGSDDESSDILESRFEKPITVLNLIKSIENLPNADIENVFLWSHSNGGQIALAVLEINRQSIPTTLWAPVTRAFPQNVLDYIGEMDDQGKMVIASISAFLEIYDPQKFSITSYLQDIEVPLQIHQGTGDYFVKLSWTDEFVNKMRELGGDIMYYTYPSDNHDLKKNWDTVVARDIAFFKKHLKP